MNEIQNEVEDWRTKMGLSVSHNPTIPPQEEIDARKAMVLEESDELCEALDEKDLAHIAQEACDLIWVSLGVLIACGIDFSSCWEELRRANMSKQKNLPRSRDQPQNWEKPDMQTVIENQLKGNG